MQMMLDKKLYSETEFVPGLWSKEINVRDFIQKNYTLYTGNSDFLEGPTSATSKLWEECCELLKQERENGGVLDMDTKIVSTITSHGAGYIDKDLETIVGLQTDAPLKRSMQPFGGIRMAEGACKSCDNIPRHHGRLTDDRRKVFAGRHAADTRSWSYSLYI